MNALSIAILLLLVGWVVWAPRRWVLVAMMAGVLFLTQGHSISIAGSSLFPTRILCYICFFRVMSRREFSFRELGRLDWLLFLPYLLITVVGLGRGDESAVGLLARMLDVVLGYIGFRGLIVDADDLRWFLKALVVLLVPYVAILAVEFLTGRNLFAVVGGSTQHWLRDGHPRCFGSFRHPSLLGSLGAAFLPLFIALMWDGQRRRLGIAGALICFSIVVFSNSGGPLSAMVVAIAGWFVWPMRERMRIFRWGIVGTIALLALVMKAPIWYLPAKMSNLTGGSGWHRSYLMDVSFRHFDQWWLSGISLAKTAHWFPYTLAATGGADVTNVFISFGFNGGVAAIALLIIFLCKAYSNLGQNLDELRSEGDEPRPDEALAWGLGVMLTVHVFNWIGITYFDQFNVVWLMQMAAISSLSAYWIEDSPGEEGEAEYFAESADDFI